jgi:hypothetical protein
MTPGSSRATQGIAAERRFGGLFRPASSWPAKIRTIDDAALPAEFA